MKFIEQYVKLENSIDMNVIDTKVIPSQKIKSIYEMIKEEIQQAVKSKIQTIKMASHINDKISGVFLSGGAISDTFIKNYTGETKDYDFFILNQDIGFDTNVSSGTSVGMTRINTNDALKDWFEKESITKSVDDREDDGYGEFLRAKNIYKIKRVFDGEEINIDLIVSSDVYLEFDLGFREFYYAGETIFATQKALRDIQNNQISINSLKTPRQTYYRLKEYEERFGLVASPVEKHILMKVISGGITHLNRTMDFNGMAKTKYYTPEREAMFYKERDEMLLTHEVYTPLLSQVLFAEEQAVVSVGLEKARVMYELGFKEEDFKEDLKINMPEWEPKSFTGLVYEEIKTKVFEAANEYNKKKNLECLYEDEDEDDDEIEWMEGPFSGIVSNILAERYPTREINNKEIRFLMFLDEGYSENQKEIVGEEEENSYLGDKEKIKELVEEREMKFKFYLTSLYMNNEIPESEFYGDILRLVGENNVSINISTEKDISYRFNYGYMSEKRTDLLKQTISPYLNNLSSRQKTKYRNKCFY